MFKHIVLSFERTGFLTNRSYKVFLLYIFLCVIETCEKEEYCFIHKERHEGYIYGYNYGSMQVQIRRQIVHDFCIYVVKLYFVFKGAHLLILIKFVLNKG